MTAAPITLDDLCRLDRAGFAAALDGIFEHAPWVAQAAHAYGPFATVASLHDGLMAAVAAAAPGTQVAFVAAHPDLAGKAARGGDIALASIAEQAGLGIDRLSDAEFELFERLNADYRARFGFPFVICVARQTRDAVLRAYARRLTNDRAAELATALAEIGAITRLRLVARVTGPGLPHVYGRLSTHVLDTAAGRPADGVAITLHEIGASARALIASARTNADGRTDAPLIHGRPLRCGAYELAFHIGDYFRDQGTKIADPPFLDIVPIRFSIAEPEGSYHVPLVVSPWSFSTYRGS